MNKKLLACLLSFLATFAISQDEVTSTLTDDVATLDITTVTSSSLAEQPVIIRQAAVQRAVTPAIVTKTILTEEEKEVVLLPSVDSISGAEIKTYQRRGVEDVLRQSAGVSVVQAGQAGGQTSLFIRGMESNHTVVLLNGRRLPPGLAGLYQLEYLDVSTLESVELTRGSASSLYGSDAIGGALDLRSTDARYVEANTIETYAEGGSFHTFRTGSKVTLRDGKLGLAFDTSYHDTANDRIDSAFENGTFRGNIAYEIADGVYFDLLGYVQDSYLEVPGSSLGFGFPVQQLNKNRSALLSPRFSIQRDNWDFSAFYSYTQNDLEATNAPFFSDSDLNQVGHEFEALFNYHPGADATYTLGVGSYDYEFSRTTLFGPPSEFDYGFDSVFAQLDLDLPANFHFLGSVRYDDHDTFESKATYTAQLSHEIEATGTTLFGKVATGYKAPSGQDFVFLPPTEDPSQIAPEESLTWEFGFRQNLFSEKNTFSATYFQADIENLVDVDPFTFASATQVDTETSGFEIEFRSEVCEAVEVYANYTYLDANVVDGTYFTQYNPGERLIRRPRHTVNAGVVTSGDRWQIGAEISGAYDRADAKDFFTGETLFVDNYTVARLFGSYDVTEKLELYGRVENVFDEQFESTRGFEAAGTGIFVGARLLLGGR